MQKNQKYKQKIELQQNYYWMFVGSPEHLEMASDILLMLARSPSLSHSLFFPKIIILEKHLFSLFLYLLFKMLFSAC